MSKIVVYDPGAAVVDAVIEYNPSANTPDYDSEPNKLVNPDLSLLEGIVPVLYWKRVGSTVVEMNQTEKETIDPQVPEERLLNEGAYDPPTENAGWEVDRGGVEPNTSLMWNETNDAWEFLIGGGPGGAEVCTGDLRVKHDTVSDSDLIFDANGRNGAAGATISRDGASGFLHLFPNSNNVQWIAGDPAAANGANTFYIDVDNEGEFRINTLPGAGRNADVWITYNANLLPGQDATSNLGIPSQQWNEVRAVTLYGDGSNITGLPAPGDPDQNLWETVAGDTGSTTASSTTQTLTIAGGTNITTAMSGNTLTINGAAGGGASVQFQWKFDNSTSASDPGSGFFRLNNSNPALATAVYISKDTEQGIDATTLLNALSEGDGLFIQEEEDSTNYILGTISTNTDNGSWHTLALSSMDDSGNLFTDGKECQVVLLFSGDGNVDAAANMTDNSIIRGDGGAKGIQDSDGTGLINWEINDIGQMTGVADAPGDYALSVRNLNATSGDGFRVQAGEALGDLAFSIQDSDGTFIIMECEADQGYVTFGKSYAQTLIDNGVVYGVDNQNNGDSSADYNTLQGNYRIGGVRMPIAEFHLFMDQVEYPASGDWAVNVGAPASPDSNNNALTVRLFDDTVDEALGFILHIPDTAIRMRVTVKARAETAPGGSQNAILDLYEREIPDNGAVTSWGSTALPALALPTNELFQVTALEQALTTWGITAGSTHQFQLVRDANNGSDNLVGDLAVLEVCVLFYGGTEA